MGTIAEAHAELALRSPGAAVLDAERCVLGCLLIDCGLYRALDRVALRVSHFGLDAHRLIYHAMLERESRGKKYDLVLIAVDLEAAGKLREAGGATYLASLLDRVPDVESVAEYAQCVIDAALIRRVARTTSGAR
jgi:replicative DNA helicase